MYVCTYVRMYVCMYVCMYVRTYVCMYVRTYVCMYVCMHVHTILLGANIPGACISEIKNLAIIHSFSFANGPVPT